MDNKETKLSEDALKFIEAACPNVKNGVYLYDQFKTLDDIRNPKSWDEFWNSGGSPFPRESTRIKEIGEVFNKGWVILEPLPENGTTLELDEMLLRKARRSGGEEHSRLKALAALWLTSQGEKQIYFERTIMGARADVYGENLDFWIECGNTSPDRLMDSLFEGGCNSFIVFPFVSHDMIEGYRFTLTIDLETRKEWLIEKAMENAREFMDLGL